jgi:hypothetical protein
MRRGAYRAYIFMDRGRNSTPYIGGFDGHQTAQR